eukprot:GILJ01024024.1.p2 GENE.GILJ01024024.1~~GILJ01024024.1.p2  ORF type:complete len:105 (+),score=11.77 GILJ01024024.1:231-545(+)
MLYFDDFLCNESTIRDQLTPKYQAIFDKGLGLDDSNLSPILTCIEKLVQQTRDKLNVDLELKSSGVPQHHELFRLPSEKGWIERAHSFLSMTIRTANNNRIIYF